MRFKAVTLWHVCIRIHLDALHLRPEDGGEICHSNQLNIKTMRIEQSSVLSCPLICSIRHFVGVTPLTNERLRFAFCLNIYIS